MAQTAVAQEAMRALRLEIARIEGRLAADATLEPAGRPIMTAKPLADAPPGAQGFEAAIGGLPEAGLVEITAAGTRDAGTASGFALALAALCGRHAQPQALRPILWIGTAAAFAELGTPYPDGLRGLLGGRAPPLLLARAGRLADALWTAEEAMAAGGTGAVLVEAQGGQGMLGLVATRRLHERAKAGGRLLLLLRHGCAPEPTAAPLRLAVGQAPSRPRSVFGRPLPGTVGDPAFAVTVSKSRTGKPLSFVLEWKADEQRFTERAAAHPGAVVPAPGNRPDPAAAAGAVLAFGGGSAAASGRQPEGEQPPDLVRARRSG